MAKKSKGDKIRIDFRKNHQGRKRPNDLTRKFQQDDLDDSQLTSGERISGKGDLTRRRTIVTDGTSAAGEPSGMAAHIGGELDDTQTGLVLRVHGLDSVVRADDGKEYRCAVRRVLKNMSTDQRHVVAAGDVVSFRPEGSTQQGIIVAIHPRRGVLSRTSKGRKHVLVANIDQIIIVASAAEPSLKPHLIDRFLVTAEQSGLEAVICINKIDLADPSELQPLVGVYAQLGYRVLLTSAARGWNIEALRQLVAGCNSVVTGQSGVGKSSLLNSIQSGLGLRVGEVSEDNNKGKHTTTTSELIPLDGGGTIIDTPGIRQFELWDVIPAEVSGLFRDLRPYANHCRFPDCTHIHEIDCAVLDAVADGRIDPRRYDSYVHLIEDPSSPV